MSSSFRDIKLQEYSYSTPIRYAKMATMTKSTELWTVTDTYSLPREERMLTPVVMAIKYTDRQTARLEIQAS